jgi:formylglycine-generating enzyme required for sulfatase activity
VGIYLDDQRETITREIRTNLAALASGGGGVRPEAELARLSRILQELAPHLGGFPELLEYAKGVGRLLSDQASKEASKKTVHDYAVVIGINHYPHLSNLWGAEEDARRFGEWLTSPAGGNLPSQNVNLLLSSSYLVQSPIQARPRLEDVENALDVLIQDVEEGKRIRRLYFYVSGFCSQSSTSDIALLMADADIKRPGYSLPIEEYRRFFEAWGHVDELLFFVDCQPGTLVRSPVAPPPWALLKAPKVVPRMLYAYSVSEQYRGQFTTVLLDGLRGHAVDLQRRVTSSSLRDYISNRFRQISTEVRAREPGFTTSGEIVIREGVSLGQLGRDSEARIFLCHASEDKPQVREIYQRLIALGFSPWLDEKDILPGQDWDYEIEMALEQSDFVMVFLSKRSVGKVGYVQREFRRAMYHSEEMPEGYIHTIPIKLDDCEVPRRFRRHQWVNLNDEGAFDRIVRALHHGLQQRGAQIPTSLETPPAKPNTAIAHPPSFTNSIGMEFVLIPAGTFMMGSPDSDTEARNDEKPAHRVTISQSFYLGKYPVTQAQWETVMGNNPSHFKDNPNHPVERVSWNDVQGFIRKLNEREGGGDYRLPTEAQWEYACRAGTETPRYHQDIDAIAWYDANSSRQTHPVGQKLPNAWGLYDMLGNVWEWVQDRYAEGYYRYRPTVDPQGLVAGAFRVYRGGSWDGTARVVRAAGRVGTVPGVRDVYLGFRCSSLDPHK